MLYLKDDPNDPDNWSTPSPDLKFIKFEDGTTRELKTSDLELQIGKHKGQALSEISDNWYLNFLKKLSTEKDDKFLAHCVDMRLNELR
jgi:hypothetical protein